MYLIVFYSDKLAVVKHALRVFMLQGEIQQLLLVDDPRAAESYCEQYIPDCDYPLPYSSLSLEPEEVQVSPIARGS